MPALFWIMAWCRSGDKPLSEPMMHGQFTDAYMRHSASMGFNVSCLQSLHICISAVYYSLLTVLFPSFYSGPIKLKFDAFNLDNRYSEQNIHNVDSVFAPPRNTHQMCQRHRAWYMKSSVFTGLYWGVRCCDGPHSDIAWRPWMMMTHRGKDRLVCSCWVN